MENQHLTYFKVENFKKFDSLEVNDIGQFNLIVGDNNVGKTCFLEALLIINSSTINRFIELLHYSLCSRNYHIHIKRINSKNPIIPTKNYFNYIKHNLGKRRISFFYNNSIIGIEDFSLNELDDDDFKKEKKHNYNIGRPEYWIKIFEDNSFKELQFMYFDDFLSRLDHGYMPIIRMGVGFDRDINHFFAETIGLEEGEQLRLFIDDSESLIQSQIKKLSLEEKKIFINNLTLFFDDVQDIMIRDYEGRDILSIKLKKNDDYVPTTYFGDGTNIFIRCLLEILKNKGGKLLIDEFGEGIHYSKINNFCKIILEFAKNQNVQLFATTHSKECEIAFAEALKEIGQEKEGRLISLQEEKKGIKAYVYPIKNLDFDYEYRG